MFYCLFGFYMDRIDLPSYYTEEDKKIVKLFKEEMDRINLLYIKAIQENDLTKANKLLWKLKKLTNTLTEEYWERADIKIPTEYLKWVWYINWIEIEDNLTKSEIKWMVWELWPVHKEAINALLNNSKNYVRASLDWVERQALSMLNEFHQAQVREELAKGTLSWESLYTMKQRLEQYFLDNELTVFKDRGGKTWTMDRYIDMLVRTETSIANVQWTINRAIQLWITKFKIIEHSDCCKECYHENWRIVDIRDWEVELPPFHPNCRWYIIAIVWDEELEDMNWKRLWLPNEEIFEYLEEDITKVRFKDTHTISITDESIIRNYTGRSYEQLNQWTPERVADRLDKIIYTNADYNWTVYRWMAFTPKEWENFLESWKIYHSWFMSTSLVRWKAKDFAKLNSTINPDKTVRVIFTLNDTKGGMNIENYARKKNQKEILFSRKKTLLLDIETAEKQWKYIYINGSIQNG